MLINFTSSGKQGNTKYCYRNVDKLEVFKCPRLAGIASCKYIACDEANYMLNFKQSLHTLDFSKGYHL